jgi:hypothetical protein
MPRSRKKKGTPKHPAPIKKAPVRGRKAAASSFDDKHSASDKSDEDSTNGFIDKEFLIAHNFPETMRTGSANLALLEGWLESSQDHDHYARLGLAGLSGSDFEAREAREATTERVIREWKQASRAYEPSPLHWLSFYVLGDGDRRQAYTLMYRRAKEALDLERDGVGGQGIANHGNTCYIAASLQALYPLLGLVKTDRATTDVVTTDAFWKDVYARLARGSLAQNNEESRALIQRVREIVPGQFLKGRQEDATELIRAILQNRQLSGMALTATSAMICCDRCKMCSATELPDASHVLFNLDPRLDALTLPLNNTDEVEINCVNCRRSCVRRERVEETSDFLIVAVNRFAFDKKRNIGIKRRDPVRIEDRLVIGGSSYALVAVVLHLGESVAFGHYTCLARRQGAWYYFDDRKVTKVPSIGKTPRGEEIQRDAYVFVYERKEADGEDRDVLFGDTPQHEQAMDDDDDDDKSHEGLRQQLSDWAGEPWLKDRSDQERHNELHEVRAFFAGRGVEVPFESGLHVAGWKGWIASRPGPSCHDALRLEFRYRDAFDALPGPDEAEAFKRHAPSTDDALLALYVLSDPTRRAVYNDRVVEWSFARVPFQG